MATALSKPRKIPFDRGWPLLGHAYSFLRNPIQALRDLYAKHGEIVKLKLPGRTIVAVLGHEANKHFDNLSKQEKIGKEPSMRLFREGLGNPKFVLAIDGEEHAYRRRKLAPGYGPKRFDSNRSFEIVECLTNEMADKWLSEKTPVIKHDLRRFTTRQIGLMLLDHDPNEYYEDLSEFLRYIVNVSQVRQWPRVMFLTPRFRRVKRRCEELCDKVIEEHRKNPPVGNEALLPLHAYLTDDHFTTQVDLRGAVYGVFLAGVDTQPNTLYWALALAAFNPDQQQLVRDETNKIFEDHQDPLARLQAIRSNKIIRGFVMEVLRLVPTVPLSLYTALEDLEWKGYQIPKGTDLWVGTSVTNFDPERYRDPEKFDTTRYKRGEFNVRDRSYLPWGLALHSCLGGNFAMLGLQLQLALLFHKVRVSPVTPTLPRPRADPGIIGPANYRIRVEEV